VVCATRARPWRQQLGELAAEHAEVFQILLGDVAVAVGAGEDRLDALQGLTDRGLVVRRLLGVPRAVVGAAGLTARHRESRGHARHPDVQRPLCRVGAGRYGRTQPRLLLRPHHVVHHDLLELALERRGADGQEDLAAEVAAGLLERRVGDQDLAGLGQ
jgi:hypothetical protein